MSIDKTWVEAMQWAQLVLETATPVWPTDINGRLKAIAKALEPLVRQKEELRVSEQNKEWIPVLDIKINDSKEIELLGAPIAGLTLEGIVLTEREGDLHLVFSKLLREGMTNSGVRVDMTLDRRDVIKALLPMIEGKLKGVFAQEYKALDALLDALGEGK